MADVFGSKLSCSFGRRPRLTAVSDALYLPHLEKITVITHFQVRHKNTLRKKSYILLA